MRALLALLTILVVLAVGTDLGQLVRVPRGPATLCCCGPAAGEHGCECTGPCCDHAPRRARDRAVAGYDEHCGARQAAPPGATRLQPGIRVAARAPRPLLATAPAPVLAAAPVPRGPSAPPEPPPRTRVA